MLRGSNPLPLIQVMPKKEVFLGEHPLITSSCLMIAAQCALLVALTFLITQFHLLPQDAP